MSSTWSGRTVTRARTIVAGWLPMQCGRCPRIVDGTEPWVVGHKISRALRPDLALDPMNWQPEHRTCSDASGQAAVIEKARAQGARDALMGVLPHHEGPGQPPHLPVSLPGAQERPWSVEKRLSWAHHVRTAPRWLKPHLVVPGDASPPLAMTEVHPLAVCSYGAESCDHGWPGVPYVVPPSAVAWIERERGLRLRWWQRLAIVRQLEHDAAGRLLWRVVVESGPRRIGKSERLRSLALWRMEHGVDLFEPGQIVVHLGRDLGIVREVQERVWGWCEGRGWAVTRGNGKEKVEHRNGARWLAKSQSSGYGFDVHLGMADECWDVDPGAISEGIEPATLERESAQLVLTSTSHRKATSLMKRRILAALAADDGRTLLLLWGVAPGADLFDERTWRAASPHWTEDRREMIAAKLAEAREAGPELDDPDPVGSWAHQYLNRWDLVVRPKVRGEQLVDAETWAGWAVERPEGPPHAAAVESWFEDGVSVALAWRRDDGTVVVEAEDFPDLGGAVAAVRASGFRGVVTVGSSLREDPAVKGKLRTRAGESPVRVAVQELQRLLAEGVVRHAGGLHLAGQVVELRTAPGVDGPRVVSTGRADAVKAAVWALRAGRVGRSSIRGIVLPSS